MLGKVGIALEYAWRRSGPMCMSPSQLGVFARSSSEAPRPDLEYHVQPLSLPKFGDPLHAFDAFTASVCNLRPTSRGSVHVTTPDPLQPPQIAPNYLATDEDRQIAAASLRLTRRIMAASALARFEPEELVPGASIQGDEALARAAGDIGTTIFHPVGTCRMGRAEETGSVVDARLRVHGIAGLRVVDASVMPTITSGNTNSPTLMIAEKACDMIREDRAARRAGSSSSTRAPQPEPAAPATLARAPGVIMSTTSTINSGLASIAVAVTGAGVPVVFLHAGVADRRMWSAQAEAVTAAGFRAVAYDRRGFGDTLSVDEGFSHVDDLVAVLDAVAAGERAILVGCSQGGRIALDATLVHPDRVRALVLVAPAISGAPEIEDVSPAIKAWIERMEAAEASADVDRINALEAHAWLDGPLAPEGRVSGAARELFLDMNELALRAEQRGTEIPPPSAWERVGEIPLPALVMWGDLDFPHVSLRCDYLVKSMPKARAHRLPGAAHLPNLEDPEGFNRTLLDFVAVA